MSEENVRGFFAKMEGDKVLQSEMISLHKESKVDLDRAIDGLVRVARAAGFEFTADEYKKVRTHTPQDDINLSATEIEMVGGCNTNWSCARVKTI